MTNEARDLNKETDETTTLPRVGLYTCPMCQGRGVCTKSASVFERNSSDAAPAYKYQTSSLDQNGFWLPQLPDFTGSEVLQQLLPNHPSPKTSLIAELSHSASLVPIPAPVSNIPKPLIPSTHPKRCVSTQLHNTNKKNTLDERHVEDIWPSIYTKREMFTAKASKPSTCSTNLKDIPKELPKAIYRRCGTNSRTTNPATPSARLPPPDLDKLSSVTTSGDTGTLLEESRRPSQPQDMLRIAIIGLQCDRWEDVVQGLQDVVQVSRWQPALIEPYMAVVNRALLSLLRGLRSHVTRLACQAAGELFRTMQCTSRPEFDELVGVLLVRTADLNRFIRQDANKALDAMVTYLPPQPCVRALLAKGCSNKHPLVRAATARLLTCCSVVAGPGGLIGQCSKKETRISLLSGAAALLGDPNQETRSFAKKLFESLVQHEDFDNIFQSCVAEKLLSHVEKTITLIKYNKHASPS